MKKSIPLLAILLSSATLSAQEIQQDLKPFNKIIASPRVNLVLKKGDKESIRLVYSGVSKNKINIEVQGKNLSIYLDHARKVERPRTDYENYRMMYEGASLTAYVTYKELESLEIRGNQKLVCYDPIEADEFRLRAYGENTITLAQLKTEYFKASLYGENELTIKKGKVIEQKYRLYGENRIDTRDLKSAYASTAIFGEGDLKINTTESIRVDAFGEPTIYVRGGGEVNKRLVLGKTYIRED